MEPSRRNQWQSAANRRAAKAAKTSEILCTGLPPVADGKEGVDGSSPSEGFRFFPAQLVLPLPALTADRCFDVHAASTSVHVGRCSELSSSSRRIACSRPSRAR
jgi:hypothetical protein